MIVNRAGLKMIERLGFIREPSGDSMELNVFDKTESKQLCFVINKEKLL